MKFNEVMLAGAVALLGTAAQAGPIIETGADLYTGLGETNGGDFDKIEFDGQSFEFTGNGSYLLQNVTFMVDVTGTENVEAGTFSNAWTIGGDSVLAMIPYEIVIGNEDTITLGGNSFEANGFRFDLDELVLTSGIGQTTEQLFATITQLEADVPAPAALPLLILGVGVIGAIRRRS